MQQVNYLRELRQLAYHCSSRKLIGSEIALLQGLYMICNLDGWSEWVCVDRSYLMNMSGLSKDAIYSARDNLVRKGRIEYIPGERDHTPSRYKIIYFNNYNETAVDDT